MGTALGALGIILAVAYGQALFVVPGPAPESGPRFVGPGSPTSSPTLSPTPTARGQASAILEPTATPTPVPGRRTLRLTAAAGDAGRVASDPATRVAATATPTPGNDGAGMRALATAMALATDQLPNLSTAMPTPTYVIVTSTPTPDNVITAVAVSLRLTAQAEQVGTPTLLPPNWVTPLVVTSTPAPENEATREYLGAVAFTTGTPTPLPANAQTATPTPVVIALEGWLPVEALSPTPSPTPGLVPPELVGKIAFLSDRAYHVEAGTQLAEGQTAYPRGNPLAYVVDPDGGGLGLLPQRWPYDEALRRDAYSADMRFHVLVKEADHWENGLRRRIPALYVFDTQFAGEVQATHFGGGMAYDPAWSPVADLVVFVSTDTQNEEIWTVGAGSEGWGSERQLTRNEWEWDKHPSWSPDGSRIVFYSNRAGLNQLWIMNADGSDPRPLMAWHPYNDWDPVWIKYTDRAPAAE